MSQDTIYFVPSNVILTNANVTLSNLGDTYMTLLVLRVPYSLFYPIEGLSTSAFDMETWLFLKIHM